MSEPDDRIWVDTTWAHVHPGATVRPVHFPEIVSVAETVVQQQRLRPYAHSIVKVAVRTGQTVSVHDFDPRADVQMLVSPSTAQAVALLAAAGLNPQIIEETSS